MCDSFSELSVCCCFFLLVYLFEFRPKSDGYNHNITVCFLFAVMNEDSLDHIIAHLVVEN